MAGVSRLFLIPPMFVPSTAAMMINAAAAARAAGVEHVLVLSDPSGELPPEHPLSYFEGSNYIYERKVNGDC